MAALKLKEDNKTLSISFPMEIGATQGDDLTNQSKAWLLKPVSIYIFDFAGVQGIKAASYRAFINFARLAKQGEKQVISINLNPNLLRQLNVDGVTSSFNPQQSGANLSVADASATAKSVPANPKPLGPSFDVAIINPFVEAVKLTIETQAQTPCKPGKAYLLRAGEQKYDAPIGVVGVINLTTAKFSGSIALTFNERVFLNICENMFGEKYTKITADVQDAASELLNIIYGQAKTVLNQLPGYDLQPALPTVMYGEKIKVLQHTREKIIILPFESSAGSFQMEIAMEPIRAT